GGAIVTVKPPAVWFSKHHVRPGSSVAESGRRSVIEAPSVPVNRTVAGVTSTMVSVRPVEPVRITVPKVSTSLPRSTLVDMALLRGGLLAGSGAEVRVSSADREAIDCLQLAVTDLVGSF